MEAAHAERLPKLAPTGRAGVRAMKGPVRRFERREAPIQCGFARTYEADAEATTPFGTTTLCQPNQSLRLSSSRAIEHSSRRARRSGELNLDVGASAETADGRGDRALFRAVQV